MKSLKYKKVGNYIPLFIFLLGLFFTVLWIQSDKTKLRDIIEKNQMFSIGTVTKIIGGHGGFYMSKWNTSPSDTKVWISFYHNGELILTQSKALLVSDKKNIGKRFVVVYDSTNIENCILLFNCPVKDSSDFESYIERFKKTPLKLEK
jgi:hypothetical protein